ncbi:MULTISPECIES: hypothetical protein [Staphylococcus]|nr:MULTISPECIES: hypothetical protein [Staphylococcus]MCI2847734.1 hypothetical protein [Staphylococcus hominis]MCI2849779.1 hypothetical protein [Staphylococcus hominis]MCI2856515.1 hypothetical protein [Staphylococcus hominis]MCI2886909.1 hypothetical protein [Staphylococcus hominis]MDS3852155.1 hypothetical protein [Staphylococcus hominis]
MIRNYFSTPKMPIFFFYTPYTIVYLVKFIFMIQNETTSWISWVWNIVIFLLGSYTYAWLSSYILDTKDNVLLRFFFMKSVLFRKKFGTIAKMTFDTHRRINPTFKQKIEGDKVDFRESFGTYIKGTFFSFIIVIIVKFILAWILHPIFWISIIIHPIIMKKYRQKISEHLASE